MFEKFVAAFDFFMRVYMRLRSYVYLSSNCETVFGFRMSCNTRDFIQRRIFHFRIYEPNLSYYILERVEPGDSVLDIGANVGYMTLMFATAVGPSGQVVAIEASPENYKSLIGNLALNSFANVTPLNVAATGGPCMVEIVAGEKNNSGTLSVRRATACGDVQIKGDALSNMPEIDRGKITFVKIDVEGTEAPVLQNLLDTLASYRSLRSIAVELAASSEKFFELLLEAGFKAYAFPNNYQIGYYFVRDYLRRSQEHRFVVKNPIETFDPSCRDYVFERDTAV